MAKRSIFHAYPAMRDFVCELRKEGLLTEKQVSSLLDVADGRVFSLRVELRVLISVGCALMVAGASLLVRQLDINWMLTGTTLLAVLGGSLLLGEASRLGQWRRGPIPEKPVVPHAVLNLGALLLSASVAILQAHYGWSNVWTLALAVVLLAVGGYSDSRIVITQGVLAIGVFLGIEAIPRNWEILSFHVVRTVGTGYALSLVLVGFLLRRSQVKNHFAITLIDIAVPVVLVASLSGIREDYEVGMESLTRGFLYALVAASVSVWLGRIYHRLRFTFYAVVALEIASIFVVAHLILEQGFLSNEFFALYICVSLVLMMTVAARMTRRHLAQRRASSAESRASDDGDDDPEEVEVGRWGLKESDWVLRRHDAVDRWRKAGVVSTEQSHFVKGRVGARPHRTNRGLRVLLTVSGLASAWALWSVVMIVVDDDPFVTPCSLALALAGLMTGLGMTWKGYYHRGIDDAAWLVVVSGLALACAHMTEDVDATIAAAIAAASVPMILFADFLGGLIVWGLVVYQLVRHVPAVVEIGIVLVGIILVSGFIRRHVVWRLRSRQLLAFQGLSMLALYLVWNPYIPLLFGVPENGFVWLHYPAEPFPFLCATMIPVLWIGLGIHARARLPLDIGIFAFAVSLLSIPPAFDLYGESWDLLVGGIVLAGLAVGIRWYLNSAPARTRFGFTDDTTMCSVDDPWTSEDLEESVSYLKDWVVGVRKASTPPRPEDDKQKRYPGG